MKCRFRSLSIRGPWSCIREAWWRFFQVQPQHWQVKSFSEYKRGNWAVQTSSWNLCDHTLNIRAWLWGRVLIKNFHRNITLRCLSIQMKRNINSYLAFLQTYFTAFEEKNPQHCCKRWCLVILTWKIVKSLSATVGFKCFWKQSFYTATNHTKKQDGAELGQAHP